MYLFHKSINMQLLDFSNNLKHRKINNALHIYLHYSRTKSDLENVLSSLT